MKVEVRRREIIKPSSPTPESLKTYHFSLVDQLSVNIKIPYVLFYDSPGNYNGVVDQLKKSLSQILSHMYPLAGRISEDKLTIECNDEGVEFIEADVDENMRCLLDNPEFEVIRKLVPCNPLTGSFEPNPDDKVLVIQVNRFSCGGMTIGLIISHAIADGSAISTFVDTWAAISRGCPVMNGGGFIFDCSKTFPPVSNTSSLERVGRIAKGPAEVQEKYTVRRFFISDATTAQLREQLRLSSLHRPTRVEALTAFAWAAVIAANQERHKGRINVHVLTTIINLRNRMEPPFPPNSLGNITYGTTVRWEAAKEGGAVSHHSLALKIRESVRAVNDGAARLRYGKGGLLQAALPMIDEILRHEVDKKDTYCLYTSSVFRMPVYQADFGWGKPRWVVNAQVLKDSAFFVEAIGGVELWMGLPEELMNILMQNQHFLECVSSFPKSKL